MGVPKVEDLKHILGNVEDVPSPRTQRGDDEKAGSSKKHQAENVFYRDSSTFLKVILSDLNFQFIYLPKKKKIIEFMTGYTIIKST